MRRIAARWLAAATIACGEPRAEPLDDADLAPSCGEAAPVQLVPLSANELASHPKPAEDRVLVEVSEISEPGEVVSFRIVSVDSCGEDLRVAFDQRAEAIPPVSAGAPWLAATDGKAIWWIDPAGQRQPTFVAHGEIVSEHDGHPILRVQPNLQSAGELTRMVVRGSGFTLEPILAGVGQTTVLSQFWPERVPPGTAFVITDDAALREVDLETGSTTIVANGVSRFFVSGRGRFFTWIPERDPDSDSRVRPWVIHDRSDGRTIEHWVSTPNVVPGEAAVHTFDNEDVSYAWMLPGLEAHVLHGSWQWFERSESGRVVAYRLAFPQEEFWVFDAPSAEPRRLPSVEGMVFDREVVGDVLWIVAGERLLRVPLDGTTPETIASPVGAPHRLGDGRITFVRRDTSDLLLLGTGAPTRVATDVHGALDSLNRFATGNEVFFVAGPDFRQGGHALYRAAIGP